MPRDPTSFVEGKTGRAFVEPITDSVLKLKVFLVVDDQSLSRTMIKAALKNMGFDTIYCVQTVSEAMALLQAGPIDLIISDWRMPNASGLDLLKWVRGQPSVKQVPYLMLTGEHTREAVVTAMQAGVSDYVTKPFSPEELRDKIVLLLRGSRASSN